MGLLLIIGIAIFSFVGERGYVLEKDNGIFLDNNIVYQYIVYPKFFRGVSMHFW